MDFLLYKADLDPKTFRFASSGDVNYARFGKVMGVHRSTVKKLFDAAAAAREAERKGKPPPPVVMRPELIAGLMKISGTTTMSGLTAELKAVSDRRRRVRTVRSA